MYMNRSYIDLLTLNKDRNTQSLTIWDTDRGAMKQETHKHLHISTVGLYSFNVICDCN